MEKKDSSVEILKVATNPNDSSIAVLTVAVDLSRPGQIATDFRRAIGQIAGTPARATDPKLYEALTLVHNGPSFRKASLRTFGHEGKAPERQGKYARPKGKE